MDILSAYAITFGWAITGSVAMALGLAIALKIFDLSTPNVDEWQGIREGNTAMAVVIASVVLSVGYVIGAAIQ